MPVGDYTPRPFTLAPPNTLRHFWKYFIVGRTNECWEWQGMCKKRYGAICDNTTGFEWRAHRISYYIHYGIDPGSLQVLHECDNPPCVNPAHLFLGTDNDNRQDCISKGRDVRGELHYCAKLTNQDIRDIRRLYIQTDLSSRMLAEQFGVSKSAIRNIVIRKTWTHV